MKTFDIEPIVAEYRREGVVRIPHFLAADDVEWVRTQLTEYIRDSLDSRPPDAATRESDGVTIRNLWRLEVHLPALRALAERSEIRDLVAMLVGGEPTLVGIETFNKPARLGSAVPEHQDNAYFCQTPPDMLTIWIAIDAVTASNGPIYFVKGSHRRGVLATKPSHVRGNSIGLADPVAVPREDQFCGLLNPGDATIHHCNTIHHSGPNRTDQARLGLLLVYRGSHTRTDPRLKRAYDVAAAMTPPA